MSLPDDFFYTDDVCSPYNWSWTTSAGNRTALLIETDGVTLTVEGRRHGCRMPPDFVHVVPELVVEYVTLCPSAEWWECALEPEIPIDEEGA